MTLYYFDLKNGITERDHAGLDLPSDHDAIARARVLAEKIGMQRAYRDHACHVSIIREDGHEVMRVSVDRNAVQPSAARLKKFS